MPDASTEPTCTPWIGAAGRGAAVNANADCKQAPNNYGNARHAAFARTSEANPLPTKRISEAETQHGKAD